MGLINSAAVKGAFKEPMKHTLKTIPPYFQHVLDGDKTFEVRVNDRGFQKGDRLLLREWVPDGPGVYTGRELEVEVTYVFALDLERVVMAVKEVS